MRARKRFGQHFLEHAWVAKLIDAIAPDPRDIFLEIGPGRGAVTRVLAPRVARLVGVEIDSDLAAALPASLPPNVRIVEGDFLDVDVEALFQARDDPGGLPAHLDSSSSSSEREGHRDPGAGGAGIVDLPVRVIGNLPYNVSSPILFKLLDTAQEGRFFADATIMLQKEVAERVAAAPGNRSYGTLAVQVARLADVEMLFTLPPGAFRPPPKVKSAVVRLRFRPAAVDVGDARIFERIVRGVFLRRRKTLSNALEPVAALVGRSAAEMLERSGLDPRRRPEELSVGDFARLSRAVL